MYLAVPAILVRVTCPYEALGVEKTADHSTIRRAYRRLTQQFHPDKHATAASEVRNAAEARFKEVSAAWAVIGDADNRAAFDQRGKGSLEDLFGDLFRTTGPSQTATNPDAVKDFFADLLGDLLRPHPPRPAPPPHAAWQSPPLRRGAHLKRPLELPFMLALRGGRLTFPHGAKHLEVTIPAGIESGAKLRLAGQGEPGHPPGDLTLEVQVAPHDHLRRQAPDPDTGEPQLALHADLPLTWAEVVTGGPLRVATPWGPFWLRFGPLEPCEGHEFELPGYGVRLRDRRGPLIYTVRLVQPPADSAGLDYLRELLGELQDRQRPRAELEGSMQ